MFVFHQLSEALRYREVQLWWNSLFKGQSACRKPDNFHKAFGICQLPAIHLLMLQLSLKSRSACKLHARTKETVQFQELKAIKAFWQRIEVHEKTWTSRNRAGFCEEMGLIDGNTKQARMVDKANVRFPGEENSSWKTEVLFLNKDFCILLKQIREQCSQKQRQGSTWNRRPKLSPGQSPDTGLKASPLLPCPLMGNPIISFLSPGQGDIPWSWSWSQGSSGHFYLHKPLFRSLRTMLEICGIQAHSLWSVLLISFILKYNLFYLHSLCCHFFAINETNGFFDFSLLKKKYISVFHITVPQFNCARLDFASEGTICTHRLPPSGIFLCLIA